MYAVNRGTKERIRVHSPGGDSDKVIIPTRVTIYQCPIGIGWVPDMGDFKNHQGNF